ncbi:MAG: hypothetical protein ABSH08_14125 [Tepidisphaeraceae bacterium]|jgi:hypothetical protein
MPELKIHVPTYYGSVGVRNADAGAKPEFGDPYVPIIARPAEGMRLVLGSQDYFDKNAPDIQVERRPNGWAIFLHPIGGSDPCGYVFFVDDGRSFVVPEGELGATPSIKVVSWEEAGKEVDGLNSIEEGDSHGPDSDEEACELCNNPLAYSGDNWDGLCPECADQVSEYLDANGLGDEDRDDVIETLRQKRS